MQVCTKMLGGRKPDYRKASQRRKARAKEPMAARTFYPGKVRFSTGFLRSLRADFAAGKASVGCVCMFNRSRSQALAVFLRRIFPSEGLGKVHVTSAGIGATLGQTISGKTAKVLSGMGITGGEVAALRTSQVDANFVDRNNLIVVMEHSHRRHILERFPQARGKVFLVTELGALRKVPEGMPDPKGETLDVFYYQTRELQRIAKRVAATVKSLVGGNFPALPSGSREPKKERALTVQNHYEPYPEPTTSIGQAIKEEAMLQRLLKKRSSR